MRYKKIGIISENHLSLSNHIPHTKLRIGIVANEPSGDQLGANLIQAIQERLPDVSFEGVGGPLMSAVGCHSLVPMESLSVMGLVEVLYHIPKLLLIRRNLIRHFLANPPHIFIGIDAPDFNLRLELQLRRSGIPTVHYVSPTVWAWRPNRVRSMRRSIDLVLSVFPFEVAFLQHYQIPVCYVGHPLAEIIPLVHNKLDARVKLGLPTNLTILALLPGSRVGEVRRLAKVFLETARWCLERYPRLYCVIPLVSAQIRTIVEEVWQADQQLPLTLVDGNSHLVLTAADLVLTASGTATLEAMLHHRPMVVTYRLDPLTYWIVTKFKLIKVPYVALSNLLAGEALAPELLQDACTPERLGRALCTFLSDTELVQHVQKRYQEIHMKLRCDSRRLAANAVLNLVAKHLVKNKFNVVTT